MNRKSVRIIAWLSSYKREQFVGIYNHLKEKHAQIREVLFVNHVESANLHAKNLEEVYGAAFDWEVTDPGDIYERIMGEASEFYQYEVLMEHNHHLMMLSNMYQIFEQQMRSFIYEELNHVSSSIKIDIEYRKFGWNWKEIKNAYSLVGYDIETSPEWSEIQMLGDIVNTFKHGEGRSSQRLMNRNPNVFLMSEFDGKLIMESARTSNFEVVFDISEIDFNHYADSIIGFWKAVPEHLEGYYTFKE